MEASTTTTPAILDLNASFNALIDQRLTAIKAELRRELEEFKASFTPTKKYSPEDWVMAGTAAKIAGLSIAWVYKNERLGRLVPVLGSNGKKLFKVSDILALRAKPVPLGIPAPKGRRPGTRAPAHVTD